MSRHLEKLLANAERQLAATGDRRPTDVLPLYKKFVKIEDHRLRLKHQAGGGGREICASRVDFVDVLLRRVFASAQASLHPSGHTPLALLALGGYGRGELNPFSDVDVMFLHGGSESHVSPYVTEMLEQVLYLLWDIGFKVGHSTRSITDAVAHANSDMLSKTAMLEARHLAGDAALVRQFRDRFRAQCVHGHEDEYVAMRMADQAARHAKYGNTVYLQEPHAKSGCGGLRDYQNLLWITYFREGELTTKPLVGKDWLTDSERRRIDAAYDFLLRVRTDLHYLTGRASDVLHLALQDQIAARLHYHRRTGVQRAEAFMKDYYEHTRNIFRTTERLTEQFAVPGGDRARPNIDAREEIGEFSAEGGQLFARDRDLFERDPEQLMRVFQIAQERNFTLSPELADLITRALPLVTRTFQYATGPRQIFQQILSRKGAVARTLRLMHLVDFLGRYIPEFGQLTCLVQHEFFHRYTADEHTLVCIEKLDALITTDDRKLAAYRELFARIDDAFVLYLALLLHDTGKAVGARPHAEASAFFAQRVAKRLQLTSEQRRSLILLVDNHVTLSVMAQQRNLDDPTTVLEFAGLVKDQKNLDALMLLTLADGQGTSADAWSDWKESLVWHLYHNTSRYFADQESFFRRARIERESLFSAVSQKLPEDFFEEVEAHFESMPDNYFRAFGPDEIVAHLRLIRRFLDNVAEGYPLKPPILWQPSAEQGHTVVALCTWDREQLLAKIAGSFSVVPLNILNVDIYPRGDNLVLDFFRVSTTSARPVTERGDLTLVETTLEKALSTEGTDIAPLLERARRRVGATEPAVTFPTRISIDNRVHPLYTLVEVQTADRVGLLFDLLSCLGREGVYIALSRVSTEKGAAVDTFYILDGGTRSKITDHARLKQLRFRLQQAAVPDVRLS